MKDKGWLSIGVFTFCFLGVVSAQWQQDIRLQKTVTLWQRDLPLEAVIQKISQQIGVPLGVGKRTPYLKLYLFVRQKQAKEVLDNLTKLLSAGGSLKAQWVPKGKGYLLQVERVADPKEVWEKFLRALLDALPLLAEGKSVPISFKGVPVQVVNGPEGARQKWQFVSTLTSEQKERMVKGQLVSLSTIPFGASLS